MNKCQQYELEVQGQWDSVSKVERREDRSGKEREDVRGEFRRKGVWAAEGKNVVLVFWVDVYQN